MITIKNQIYRFVLSIYSLSILYIETSMWLDIVLSNPGIFQVNILNLSLPINTSILAYSAIFISTLLIMVGLYKEEVSYIISSPILMFTVVLLSVLGLYMEGSISFTWDRTSSIVLTMGIEIVLMIIISGILDYIKPYLKLYTYRGITTKYSLNIGLLDIVITSLGLFLGILFLAQIPYIITQNIYSEITGLKDRIIGMLGSITYLILTYPLTYFFIYLGIFLFILYLFKNVIDPFIIFIGKGRGQAFSILKEDFGNELHRSLSYIKDTDRYVNIGFIMLIAISMVPILLSISYSYIFSIRYFVETLFNLFTYRHNPPQTIIDYYINNIVDQRIVEDYIAKVARFLRLILSFLL